MQHLNAMYIGDGPAPNTLVFRINLATPGAVEQVGFVHYLNERFEGRRTAVERYHVAPHYSFGSVTIGFPDEQTTKQAMRFCDENLTESGMPGHEARRDVKHSDLRDRKAEHWMRDIHAAPIREAATPTDQIEEPRSRRRGE